MKENTRDFFCDDVSLRGYALSKNTINEGLYLNGFLKWRFCAACEAVGEEE